MQVSGKHVMHWIGLDVGGANHKAADCDGIALTKSFPVWKEPERLTAVLGEILTAFPQCDAVAVTIQARIIEEIADVQNAVSITVQARVT